MTKGRVVLLDEIKGRPAAALVVDGVLEDLAIDPEGDQILPGAIYRAIADRPMKGQGGIFVKLPGGASGFLRQISGISPGQRMLVQVTGPTEPGKATPVTARLLFKSRHAIITPDAPGLNVSRAIRDEEVRADLTALAEEVMAGADPRLGLILRSTSAEADEKRSPTTSPRCATLPRRCWVIWKAGRNFSWTALRRMKPLGAIGATLLRTWSRTAPAALPPLACWRLWTRFFLPAWN